MKTSNKIFLSFLIFLFSGIIALYLGSKYYVEEYDTTKLVFQDKPLPPFSVVVAEPNTSISMTNSPTRKISQSCFKEAKPKFGNFLVRNDTLFFKAAKQDQNKIPHARFMANIFCDNVKHIVAKENSIISFGNYKVDSLFVKMNNAFINDFNHSINYIQLIAKNSRIDLDCGNLNAVNVELIETRLNLTSHKKINSMTGIAKKSSELNLDLSGKISLDVDGSSRLNIYNSED